MIDEPSPENGWSESTSARVRWYLKEQDGRCFYCLCAITEATYSRDHATPRYLGGTLDDGNMILTCYPCNNAKKTFTFGEMMAILGGPFPTTVPFTDASFGKKKSYKQHLAEVQRAWCRRQTHMKRKGVNPINFAGLMRRRKAYKAAIDALHLWQSALRVAS